MILVGFFCTFYATQNMIIHRRVVVQFKNGKDTSYLYALYLVFLVLFGVHN